MTGLIIRPVAPDEHDAVDALIATAYEFDYGPTPHGEDELQHSVVRAERFEVWNAADGETGELLGSITTPRDGGEQLLEDATPNELDFRLLAVSPRARRRGVGAALTRHVVDLARERGLRRVFLKSAPNMTGAHRLYESLGFRRDPDRDGLVIDGVVQFDLFAFVVDVDPIASTPQEQTS